MWGVLSVVYFLTYAFYNARARIRLGKLTYNRFRTGNLLHSWQVGLKPSTALYFSTLVEHRDGCEAMIMGA